jgi:dipeptidyl aminopeptidase/acylaminoacyl peptidase
MLVQYYKCHLPPEFDTRRKIMSNRLSLILLVGVGLAAWLAAAVPATCETASESVAVPPIETFMQIGSATGGQITQDGSMLFFSTSISGVDQVYRLMPSGWPYQMTVFTDGIDFFKVSPAGRWVVVGASVGGSEQADLFLIDTATGMLSTLKQDEKVRHGSPLWSNDEKYLYFSSNEENMRDFMLYRMEISSRKIEKVWHKDSWNGVSDISADGNKLLAGHWISNMNSDFFLIDLVDGSEVLLTEHQDDYVFDYGRLTPDAKYLYFATNMNDDGLIRVARMDVSTREMEFINPDSPWEVEDMELSPDGRYLAWVENVEGYGTVFVLDTETDERTQLSEMKGIATGLEVSGEGTLVFTFTSSALPPDIWTYGIATGTLEQMTFSTFAGIDKGLFVEPRLIRYTSFDGLKVPAFLYMPPGWDGKPIPFVVHAHGGPESQFRPSFVRHFQYLILNGYGVLAPNIRGSSGYGRDYVMMDDYEKRKDSIRDLYEAARWLVENNYAETGRIGIKGGSYGGYATLAALVDYPDMFGAGIDNVGIANFVTFLQNTAEYRRAIREAEYGPLSDPEFLTSVSPLTNADRIRAPLLVVHGENDPRVPVGEARQIAEAVQANGGVAELLIFPDEGHGIAKLGNRLVYYRRMVEFLDEHLKD